LIILFSELTPERLKKAILVFEQFNEQKDQWEFAEHLEYEDICTNNDNTNE